MHVIYQKIMIYGPDETGSQSGAPEAGDQVAKRAIEILYYIKENGGPSLTLIYEGRECEIFPRPDNRELSFQDGKNQLLVSSRPDLRLTLQSHQHLHQFIKQKELANAQSAAEPDHVGDFRATMDKIRDGMKYGELIARNPEAKKAIQELEQYVKEIQIASGRANSSYSLFYGHNGAGQILLQILNTLRVSERLEMDENIQGKKEPSLCLATRGNRDIIRFIEVIAEIIGCKETFERYVGERKDQMRLFLFDSGGSKRYPERIDSAHIIFD